jgi:transposase-like protein
MDCSYCHYPIVIKWGWYWKEGQRYKCKSCDRTFIVGWTKRKTYSFKEKQRLVQLSNWYGNLSRICRAYKLSKNTIYNRRKDIVKYQTHMQTKIGYY